METDEERRLFELGEKNYKAKKQLRTRSLLQQTPNDEESDLIHAMWTKEMAYLSMCRHYVQHLITQTGG